MKGPFDYISPCPSNLFVGREREASLFKGQMDRVMNGEETSKGLIIHGRPGIGKTSLINKLKTVAGASCYVVSKEIPLEGAQYFFDDLKAEILDVIKRKLTGKPVKRGKDGKNAPYLVRLIPDKAKYLENFYKKFTKNLDKNQKNIVKAGKKGIVVFIDKIERFVNLDLMLAFELLKGILENITTEVKGKPFNIPILFVISAWERYYPRIKYILTNFEEIGVPTLNMAEAKELLSKHSSQAGINFSDEVADLVVETSLNVPQMILYNAGYIHQNSGGAREITKDVWFNLENAVKIGFDRELDIISDDERKVLQAFSMSKENFAEVVTVAQMTGMAIESCGQVMQGLFEKNILVKEGDYFSLTLNSFWEHLRNSLGDIAIGAQARGVIRVAEDDAENGRLFSDYMAEEMERLRSDAVTAGLVSPIELIARGYERIFDSTFKYEYYNEAFKYILLAGDSYIKINEVEKAAHILERAAGMFKAKAMEDYTRDVLVKTIETYTTLGNTGKVTQLKLDLAQLCKQKADDSMEQNNFPLARANYSRAQRLLDEIDENQLLLEMLETAANNFMGKQEHFYAWQFYGKLSDTYLKMGNNAQAAAILKNAADKFSSAGLNKFADKLNEQLAKKVPGGAS